MTPTTVSHLEAKLERVFSHRVRSLGGMVIKLAPTERGVPDRLVLMPGGHMYLVELKAAHGTLSKIQHHWHQRAANLGTRVVVLYGHEGVVGWLNAVAELGHKNVTAVQARERMVERRVWRAIAHLRDPEFEASFDDLPAKGPAFLDGFRRGVRDATLLLWARVGVQNGDSLEPYPDAPEKTK